MSPEKQKCGLSPQKYSEYRFFDSLRAVAEISATALLFNNKVRFFAYAQNDI